MSVKMFKAMSEIGSNYSDYKRSVDELEADYQSRLKRQKEAQEKREQRLTDKFEATRQQDLEESRNSLEQLKDTYGEERLALTKNASYNQRGKLNDKGSLERSFEQRLHSQNLDHNKELQEVVRAERVSRDRERSQLADQVKEVQNARSELGKAKNAVRAEVIRESETGYRDELKNQSLTHDAEIKQKADQNKATETYLYRSYEGQKKEMDGKFANQMKNKDQAYARETSENQKNFDNAFNFQKEQFKKERAQSYQSNQAVSERVRAQTEKAHMAQSEASRQHTLELKAAKDAEITDLNQKVVKQKASQDLADIPPAAEKKLIDQMTAKEAAALGAESARNRKSEASIYRRLRDEQLDQARTQSEKARDHEAKQMLETQRERMTLERAILDQQTTLRNEGKLHREALAQTQDQSLDRENMRVEDERRRFNEALKERDYKYKNKDQLTENKRDFESMEAIRQHQFETQELKLRQAMELASIQDKAKADLKLKQQELDQVRRSQADRVKQALDEQAQSYEQRISEKDADTARKLRMAEIRHETELQKVKSTHELKLAKLSAQSPTQKS